ncbi:hypothetical protein FJT64_008164 [Amphibalanus amphitrite]|uniref:Uncharacterized protein n=1 Tax=Amphibalanus amphitrite TaxID=1232801 RepID=A0A6A4VCS8_AMPAM|nr:hypothetical protein FJT64_008164 [Amphibalanus amphitrite]
MGPSEPIFMDKQLETSPDLSLKSVTGQALELIGCGEDSWEFHPHNQNADEPVKPLRCIIEADRIGEGLMIGIANYTSRSYKFRNDEPLGFLTQAQVIPFSELLSPSTDEAPGTRIGTGGSRLNNGI